MLGGLLPLFSGPCRLCFLSARAGGAEAAVTACSQRLCQPPQSSPCPLCPLAAARLTCRPSTRCSLQEVIVIDTAEAREATEEILRLHSIPAMVSKDLTDVLAVGSSALVATAPPTVEAAAAALAAEVAGEQQGQQQPGTQAQPPEQPQQQEQPQQPQPVRPAAA